MNETKITAHQLWCNQIQEELEEVLYPNRIKNGKSAFMTSKEVFKRKAEEARAKVVTFENLRLRILVDEMIILLDSSKSLVDTTKQLRPAWYRFQRLREWQKQLAEHTATMNAYQTAVLILVNTKPPSK